MTSFRFRWFVPAVVLAALAWQSALLAGPSEDARARFQLGEQAYREARYKDAIELFLQAHKLDPHPELVFNAGQAYEKLGDVPNALRLYREYLRAAPGASDRATLETKIRNLEQRLREKGVQQASILSTPPGATVVLDGRAMGNTPWTGEIVPGRHIVVLKLDGYPDTAKEFVLANDRSMDIDVALGTQGSSPAVALPPSGVPPVKEPAQPVAARSVKPLTWIVLGVGAVGLGSSLAFEFARRSAESDARGDPTQVGYNDAYDRMQGRQTVARVLLGVGAAAAITGGVLLYLDLQQAPAAKPASAARLGLGCTGASCALVTAGTF